MKKLLKYLSIILILIFIIIINITGIPIVNNPSTVQLVFMCIIYLLISILVLYIYFTISRLGDIFDSIDKGVDATKEMSNLISESYSNKRISLKQFLKFLFKIKY